MMFKNGLFLVSIGLIIAVVNVDAQAGTYNWLSLVTALFIALMGLSLIWFDYRKKKKVPK